MFYLSAKAGVPPLYCVNKRPILFTPFILGIPALMIMGKKKKTSALEEVQKSKALDKAIDKAMKLKQQGTLDWKTIKMFAEDVTQEIIDKGDAKIEAFQNLSWKEKVAMKMFRKKAKQIDKKEAKKNAKVDKK